MNARQALLLLGIVGIALGFVLWSMPGERERRAHDVSRGLDVGELDGPLPDLEPADAAATDADARASRDALPSAAAESGTVELDVEVVAVETGEPLAGIRLLLVSAEGKRLFANGYAAEQSDARGRAVFRVPAEERYQLESMRAPGVEDSLRELSAPAAGERVALRIEVRTLPDAWFYGRVLDVETQQPLAGACAVLGAGRDGEQYSDAHGLVRLEVRSWEHSTLRVELEGYAWTLLRVSAGHGTPAEAVDIHIARSARLVARLERVGGPVAGLELVARTEARNVQQVPSQHGLSTEDELTWRATVDAEGAVTLAGLPPRVPLSLEVLEEGRSIELLPEPVNLGIGEERALELQLGAGCRLVGRALEADGTPADGLEVWLVSETAPFRGSETRYLSPWRHAAAARRTVVDAAGRFEFDELDEGVWWVGPAPGHPSDKEAVAPLAERIEVAREDVRREVVLEVHRGLTIRGRVVGPDGEPVLRALVSSTDGAFESDLGEATFTLGPLVAGELELVAQPMGGGDLARSEPVRVRAGEQDAVLQLRRGRSLVVVVRDPAGELARADVRLLLDDPTGQRLEHHAFPRPLSTGTYVFRGVPPGVYHVQARAVNGNVGSLPPLLVDESAGSRDYELTLSPGARVRVRVSGAPADALLHVEAEQNGVRSGHMNLRRRLVVFPGPLTLRLKSQDRSSGRVDVLDSLETFAVEGEELEVEFEWGRTD